MRNSFFLVIPTQQKNTERAKQFKEKALEHWIAEFPTANPGLATRLFHDLIVEFNSLEFDEQQRLEALEMLRANFLLIEDYLRSRLMAQGFPKGENEQKILNVLVAIEKEFTIGYWMVVKSLTHRSIGWFKGKQVGLALQRTIKGLSSIVITHYIMRLAVPDWVWIDLHSLYKLSVRLKKDGAKVTEKGIDEGKTSSPGESYRQVLMLGLTDAAGLRQKEIQQVYNFLGRFSSLIKLVDQPVSGLEKQCVVLVDEDQPPFFQEGEAKSAESQILYIDQEKFNKVLQQKAKLVVEGEARFSSVNLSLNEDDKLAPELLDYLEQRWAGVVLHGAPYFPDRLDRCIAVGLNATHDLLMQEDTLLKQETEFLVESDSARVLSGLFNKPGILSIGSMISFRKTDGSVNKRSLGMVNKIEVAKSGSKLSFELQVLAPQVHAVGYKLINAAKDDEQHKALLFGIKTEAGEKRCIIIESFMLKEDDVVRMYMQEENFPVLLSNRKNVGLGYWQFECRRVEETVDENSPEAKKGYDFI